MKNLSRPSGSQHSDKCQAVTAQLLPKPAAPQHSDSSDYDNPWKGALEVFFQPFLELLFPQVACLVDWQFAPEFLDKELLQIVSEAELGRRTADKLVKLRLLDGTEHWVLVHVEVQDSSQPEFAERMFVYYYRIRDRYRKPVISLAVLTDTRRNYRPDHYHTGLAGCSLRFDFITAKLLDWQERRHELLTTPNPFGLLVAAQLTAKLVRDGRQRADNLMAFYRLAIEKNVKKEHIRELVNFLEWIVSLPKSAQPYYENWPGNTRRTTP